MGKVSILKSFSLAAAVLCIVGISASPASAKIKKANPNTAKQAYGTTTGVDTSLRAFSVDTTVTGGGGGTNTVATALASQGLIYVPTSLPAASKTQCVGSVSPCPVAYQAISSNASANVTSTTTGNIISSDGTVNANNKAIRGAYCEASGSEFEKGKCKYGCRNNNDCSALSSVYNTCSGGVCIRTSCPSGKNLLTTAANGSKVDTCVQCTQDSHCSSVSGKTHCLTAISTTNYNQCVACLENSHCSGSTPGCLTYEGSTRYYTCRQCTLDSHCSGKENGSKCLNSIATYGSTQGYTCGCTSNDQCSHNSTKKICDTSSHVCRAPQNDSECAAVYPSSTKYYVAAKGCVACSADSHCTSSSAPWCNISGGTYTCVNDCSKANTKSCSSATSSSTPVCSGSACVECASHSDCSATNNKICRNNVCTNLCQSSSECSGAYNNSNYVCAKLESGSSGGTGRTWYTCDNGTKICDAPCGSAQAICMTAY